MRLGGRGLNRRLSEGASEADESRRSGSTLSLPLEGPSPSRAGDALDASRLHPEETERRTYWLGRCGRVGFGDGGWRTGSGRSLALALAERRAAGRPAQPNKSQQSPAGRSLGPTRTHARTHACTQQTDPRPHPTPMSDQQAAAAAAPVAAAGPAPAPERSIDEHFADVPLFMRELGEEPTVALEALQSLAHDGTPDGPFLAHLLRSSAPRLERCKGALETDVDFVLLAPPPVVRVVSGRCRPRQRLRSTSRSKATSTLSASVRARPSASTRKASRPRRPTRSCSRCST
jgi:hypothetical protein